VDELATRAGTGDRSSVARLLTLVEGGGDASRLVARRLHGHRRDAFVVGITARPGAGKSTLVDQLVSTLRPRETVAVVAIDPSSPRSGGAVLGDRVRMQGHVLDPGVYIRSMATRGQHGGLALAAHGAVRVFESAGFAWVIVETVGTGQVEVDVGDLADTVVAVVNPGWGDEMQAAKAGLLEIADLFVVNKADRPGISEAVLDQTACAHASSGWAGRGGPIVARGRYSKRVASVLVTRSSRGRIEATTASVAASPAARTTTRPIEGHS
jgi:LAO/AO transport system kinase